MDICDPVLPFDRFMGGINLEKYLNCIPVHQTGRIRYQPVNMLKTVLFGFMTQGYMSLRELEDKCKVNIRFMYLMKEIKIMYKPMNELRHLFLGFNQLIGLKMNPDNRWIKMADRISWGEFEIKYAGMYYHKAGADTMYKNIDDCVISVYNIAIRRNTNETKGFN